MIRFGVWVGVRFMLKVKVRAGIRVRVYRNGFTVLFSFRFSLVLGLVIV